MNEDLELHLHEPREIPKVEEVVRLLTDAIVLNKHNLQRMKEAKDTRDAVWNGKTRDGKRVRDEDNRLTGPWENSSDTSEYLAEQVIGEKAVVLMLALQRSQLTAEPQEFTDAGKGAIAVSLMRYYLTRRMKLETWTGLGRAADLMLTYGHGIVEVGWKRSVRMVGRSLTYETLLDWAKNQGAEEALAELAALAEANGITEMTEDDMATLEEVAVQAGEQAMAETTRLMATRQERPALVALLEEFDPDMCEGEAQRLAARLQAAREAEHDYYAHEETESRPQWRCLHPWVDIFYTGLATSLQDERFVACVEWVNAITLKERAALEGWDEKWVEKVLDNPGRAFGLHLTDGSDWILQNTDVNWSIPQKERDTHWFMLTKVYYKAVNRAGVTAVWECLVHDAVADRFAYHRLADVPDGEYPFVEFPRELARRVTDNRGIPELVESEQEQLKGNADAWMDQTALRTQPPLAVHWKDMDKQDWSAEIRPRGIVPMRDGEPPRFMNIPGSIAEALKKEELLRAKVYRRFGLMDVSVPETLTQMVMELDAAHFLKHLNVLLTKTWQLVSLNMPEEVKLRVAGGAQVFADGEATTLLEVTRAEVQGLYDFNLTFDPRDLNLDWVMKRQDAIVKMVQALDHTGATQTQDVLRYGMAAIDPRLARMVQSATDAQSRQAEEEQQAWAVIFAGEEPPMPETGVDFATRFSVWETMIQRSPEVQQRLRTSETVLRIAQTRLKWLKQGMRQQQNAVTGRRGTLGAFEQMQERSLIGE